MRVARPLVRSLAALVFAAACQKSVAPQDTSLAAAGGGGQAAPAAAAAASPPAQAATGAAVIHGTVKEKIDSGGYSYLRLAAASGEVWAAVPLAQLQVGAEVDVSAQMNMDGFESKTLNRKFDKLVFGALAGAGNEAAAPSMGAAMGAGAPGGFRAAGAAPAPGQALASAAAGQNPHANIAAPALAPDTGPIKVAKAKGKDARTVAEVFAQKAALKDAPVTVSGKVVKYNEGIMGHTWIHLKDGSGAAGSDDITVTTSGKAALGDTVTIHGTVHLDKDFGAGYAYAVIIEDATMEKAGL